VTIPTPNAPPGAPGPARDREAAHLRGSEGSARGPADAVRRTRDPLNLHRARLSGMRPSSHAGMPKAMPDAVVSSKLSRAWQAAPHRQRGALLASVGRVRLRLGWQPSAATPCSRGRHECWSLELQPPPRSHGPRAEALRKPPLQNGGFQIPVLGAPADRGVATRPMPKRKDRWAARRRQQCTVSVPPLTLWGPSTRMSVPRATS
jgi:hypothetical protein